MEVNNLFYCKLFVFRSKHNTVDEIAEFTEKIRAYKGMIEVPTVFHDWKKKISIL